jgi:hypothetical protein
LHLSVLLFGSVRKPLLCARGEHSRLPEYGFSLAAQENNNMSRVKHSISLVIVVEVGRTVSMSFEKSLLFY